MSEEKGKTQREFELEAEVRDLTKKLTYSYMLINQYVHLSY